MINDTLGIALFIFIVTTTYAVIALMAKTLSGRRSENPILDLYEIEPQDFDLPEEALLPTSDKIDALRFFVKNRRPRTRNMVRID